MSLHTIETISRLNSHYSSVFNYFDVIDHFHSIYQLSRSSLRRFYCRAAWNADAIQRWELCLSVCPSVRLSVTRVDYDKTV